MRLAHKKLVTTVYPRAVCIRRDLGGAYSYTVYTDVYGKGRQIATGDSAAEAWSNAYANFAGLIKAAYGKTVPKRAA